MPVLNVESQIKKALGSVAWCDEIIVIDMGSKDKTREIARSFNSRVIVSFPPKDNFDLNRKLGFLFANGEWLLKLDSDEVISMPLQQEIIKTFKKDIPREIGGFKLLNKIYFFGREIKHGFVKPGSHELRIIRTDSWNYDPYKFHQQIKVLGKTPFLKNHYLHYNYSDISQFVSKTNKYTSLDALAEPKNDVGLLQIILAPIRSFIKLYMFQYGCLDGTYGFIISSLFAFYNQLEKLKVYEAKLNLAQPYENSHY